MSRVTERWGLALSLALLGSCGSSPARYCARGECAVDLEVSFNASCVLTEHGGAKCWGLDVGQFGVDLGTAASVVRPTAVDVPIPEGTVRLAAGNRHLCAMLDDRSVRCWGLNDAGQLGDDSTQARLAPVSVAGLGPVLQLAAGGIHTCALTDGGTVRCWGGNALEQLGNPDVPAAGLGFSTVPVEVRGLPAQITGIFAGPRSSCALVSSDTVWCWGDNRQGQLGNPAVAATSSAVPVQVAGLERASALALGKDHACALLQDLTVACWGSNTRGQVLGTRLEPGPFVSPTPVPGLAGVEAIAAGENHTCALLAGGRVRCWGASDLGEMGDGKGPRSASETSGGVSNVVGATAISAGFGNACALLEGVGVRCWGYGYDGQLGNGLQGEATLEIYLPANVVF